MFDAGVVQQQQLAKSEGVDAGKGSFVFPDAALIAGEKRYRASGERANDPGKLDVQCAAGTGWNAEAAAVAGFRVQAQRFVVKYPCPGWTATDTGATVSLFIDGVNTVVRVYLGKAQLLRDHILEMICGSLHLPG